MMRICVKRVLRLFVLLFIVHRNESNDIACRTSGNRGSRHGDLVKFDISEGQTDVHAEWKTFRINCTVGQRWRQLVAYRLSGECCKSCTAYSL
jgi:hypothetical protein